MSHAVEFSRRYVFGVTHMKFGRGRFLIGLGAFASVGPLRAAAAPAPGGKMGMIREDHQHARRSLIVQSGDAMIAMVTSPVSLFSLAYGLMERPDLLYVNHIDAALNLSSAATTSFYAKARSGEVFEVPAFWPNREVITFAPRGIGA